jgi:hypothetical protein
VHVYPFTLSAHNPPFLQGPDAHSFMSEMKHSSVQSTCYKLGRLGKHLIMSRAPQCTHMYGVVFVQNDTYVFSLLLSI